MDHLNSIKNSLSKFELDSIMLTEEANRFYASGFLSSGGDGIAIISQGKSYYITDSRYEVAAKRCIKDAEVIITSGENDSLSVISEIIADEDLKCLGFDDNYMSVKDLYKYSSRLSCELIPASRLMSELRAVKDEQEIKKLIKAQRIAEKAFEETLPMIKEGITEKQIAAFLIYRMLENGAAKPSFDPIVVSGINTTMPHGVPSDKKLEKGDFVTMDFGVICDGYCSDMTRTFAVGYATDEMKHVYNIVLNAQKTAISNTRAGLSGRNIDDIARNIISDAGYGSFFGHGYGHGLGIEIHEAPTLSPRGTAILQSGNVTSAEPGIYIPGKFGVRIEDVTVIRENGCEDITDSPKELIII